jgi:hypothetical protein
MVCFEGLLRSNLIKDHVRSNDGMNEEIIGNRGPLQMFT